MAADTVGDNHTGEATNLQVGGELTSSADRNFAPATPAAVYVERQVIDTVLNLRRGLITMGEAALDLLDTAVLAKSLSNRRSIHESQE